MKRRKLLGSAGTVLAALVVLRPQRSPQALTIEELPPASPDGLAFANHCGGASEHAGLLAQLQGQLAGRTAESGTTLTATATCPICGCPVTATRTVK
jgi:hypothetical protein